MARGPSRRAEILEAASEHFRAAGFDGTALSMIAHSAGVSKAAVSFHFESKEAMLLELVEPLLSELEAVLAANPLPDWPHGVRRLTGEYFDVLVRHHAIAAWLDSDASAQRRDDIGRRLGRSMEGLAEAVTGGSRDAGARVRAFAAVGGIWRPVRVLPVEALAAHREELLDAALSSFASIEPPLSHTA
ncbi:MAG: TetR/AcrR family transcriptional regulator [Actinobacteria bacterium]|nr:MAG: TetR/AcrR family transcriptional regulator [Actinomycetota bacterium]